MVERAEAASRAGLASLFVGDHHVTPRPYYQNSAILGRLLAVWDERPAGALYLLPLWHPVLLAQQTATLAAIARGPFVLQCAIGAADRQFDAYGVDPRHRPSRFEECLDAVRRLWAGEEVASDGRYRFRRARIAPLPPEPVPVWIGASADAAIDRAARLGDGWIASPHLVPGEAHEQAALYRERCAAHGRPVGATVIRRDVFVGESADEARARAIPVIESGYRGFSSQCLVIGGPTEVAAAFAELGEAGYDEILVRNLIPDQSLAVASTERLAAVRELLAAG